MPEKTTMVQVITWANIDPYLCHHMKSLSHDEYYPSLWLKVSAYICITRPQYIKINILIKFSFCYLETPIIVVSRNSISGISISKFKSELIELWVFSIFSEQKLTAESQRNVCSHNRVTYEKLKFGVVRAGNWRQQVTCWEMFQQDSKHVDKITWHINISSQNVSIIQWKWFLHQQEQ